MSIQYLIEKYNLSPHPEGGFYREVYRSEQMVESPETKEVRNAITHIYFLLLTGQVSRFHSVIHDEIWNFYEGDPLQLITFDGDHIEEGKIGKNCDSYNYIVRGGLFQAAETTGEYTLVGCTVAPGFDFKDFTFLTDDYVSKDFLLNNFPDYKKFL